jgi:hypothetical protein
MEPPLSVEQQQPDPGADIDDAGTGTTSSRFERGIATAHGVDVMLLPEGCLPASFPKSFPVVIPQNEVALDAGPLHNLELGQEAALRVGPFRILRFRQAFGICVVSQENHNGLPSLHGKLSAQRLENRLTAQPGRSRISQEIDPGGNIPRRDLGDRS